MQPRSAAARTEFRGRWPTWTCRDHLDWCVSLVESTLTAPEGIRMPLLLPGHGHVVQRCRPTRASPDDTGPRHVPPIDPSCASRSTFLTLTPPPNLPTPPKQEDARHPQALGSIECARYVRVVSVVSVARSTVSMIRSGDDDLESQAPQRGLCSCSDSLAVDGGGPGPTAGAASS